MIIKKPAVFDPIRQSCVNLIHNNILVLCSREICVLCSPVANWKSVWRFPHRLFVSLYFYFSFSPLLTLCISYSLSFSFLPALLPSVYCYYTPRYNILEYFVNPCFLCVVPVANTASELWM